MARTYKRDSKGRFAGGGGSSSRADRSATWVRGKSGWERNWGANPPKRIQDRKRKDASNAPAWVRAERTANWVRRNGEWTRNR